MVEKTTVVTPSGDPAGDPDLSNPIAKLLLDQAILPAEQLAYAQRILAKLGDEYSLVRVLKDLNYLSSERLKQALREHGRNVPLGTLLVELGYLRPTELTAALLAQKDPQYQGVRLGEFLLKKRIIQEQDLIEVLADQLNFPSVEPRFSEIPPDLLVRIKPDWCRQTNCLPLRHEGNKVLVAFIDPLDQKARDAAESVFGDIIPAITSRRAMEEAVTAYANNRTNRKALDSTKIESTTTTLVDELISEGISQGASDIHIEPTRTLIRVRFRRDGVLHIHKELDSALLPTLSSRLKVLAGADIAERRRHQGGGFRFVDPRTGERCDVRASWYATINGENIVLRLLSRKAELLDIKEVGMTEKMLTHFLEDALDVPSGVVLITGPTGSGKTTTLYGCVNYLNDSERSISTAEDPVEYVIDGIAQCNLNSKLDITFEETLRHMMRQDPDVLVLGEIRDQFSAESAIQAALTGHKVLTTFHTEDSIGGLLRLMNMNIETFLISSTVVSVLAQRLIRHVCRSCAEPYHPAAHILQRIGYTPKDIVGGDFKRGRGCEHCHYSGFSGRVGVFELLVLNEAVKDAILLKKTSSEIRRISVETSGLITLMEDGISKAANGMTTMEEVLRHLPRLGKPRPLREIRRLSGAIMDGGRS